MSTETSSPSVLAGLVHDLRDRTLHLLQQEVRLAKTELQENAAQLSDRLAATAAGAALLLAGGLLLLLGLSNLAAVGLVAAGLNPATAAWVGPGALGLLILVIGWTVFARARRKLSLGLLVPDQSIESLQRDQEMVREKIHAHTS